MMKKWLPWTLIVLLLDRVTKLLAQRFPGPLPLLPGVMQWNMAQNTGMVFGLLSKATGLLGTISLAVSVAAVALLLKKKMSVPVTIGVALLLGGALGNGIDRIFFGSVVDMLEITLFRFAVFNVADVALCVGLGILMVCVLFSKEDGGEAHERTDP